MIFSKCKLACVSPGLSIETHSVSLAPKACSAQLPLPSGSSWPHPPSCHRLLLSGGQSPIQDHVGRGPAPLLHSTHWSAGAPMDLWAYLGRVGLLHLTGLPVSGSHV